MITKFPQSLKSVRKFFSKILPATISIFLISNYAMPLMGLVDFGVKAASVSVLDTADMGEDLGQPAHNLTGWSSLNISGGYGAGDPDKPANYRQIIEESDCTESGRSASVTLHSGMNYANLLRIRHLDGQTDDSFEVRVNGNLIGSYIWSGSTAESWETSEYTLNNLSGDLTVTLTATGTIWGGCSTYGQGAIGWIEIEGYPYLAAPENLGWNERNYSGDDYATPRPDTELGCGGFTNQNAGAIHWTDVAAGDPQVKYQRQYKVLPSGGWAGSEIYTTLYSNFRSFGGGEKTYDTRVRAFYDLNDNNLLDTNEPSSAWSANSCTITYDVTAPAQPAMKTVYKGHNPATWEEIGCDGLTNTTQVSIEWYPSSESDIAGYWFGTKFNDHHQYFTHPNVIKTANMTPENNPYWYTVIAVDLAGNESIVSDPCGLTLDQEAPEAPIILIPSEDDYFNSSPILNQWSPVSDDSGIDYYRIQYEYDDGHTFSGYPYRTTTSTSRNHVPADWEEGGVSFRVQAFDNAGNEGAWSEWRHYYYDLTAPSTSLSSPDTDSIWRSPVTISGTTLDDNLARSVNLYYRESDSAPGDWIFIHNVVNLGDTASFDWTYEWDQSVDGTYDIKAAGVDEAGNEESSAVAYRVVVDNTAPEVTLEVPEQDEYYSGTIGLRATCNEECDYVNFWWRNVDTGEIYAHYRYHYVHDNGTVFEWDLDTLNAELANGNGTPGDSTDDYYVMEDGNYQMYAAAKDVAGNWARSVNVDFVVDNTAPVVNISEPSDGDIVKGSVDIWGSIVDDNLSHYNIAIYDGGVDTWNFGLRLEQQTVYGPEFSDSLIYTWDTTGYEDGEYQIRLAARDLAGNRDPVSPSYPNEEGVSVQIISVIVDNTAPVVEITNPLDGDYVNGTVDIQGTVTDENPDHYWLVVQGAVNGGPGVVNETDSFVDQSLFLWDTIAYPDGEYTIKLEARDAAGNKDPNLAPVPVDPEVIGDSVDWITVHVDNTIPTGAFNNIFVNEIINTGDLPPVATESDGVFSETIENLVCSYPAGLSYPLDSDDSPVMVTCTFDDLAGNIGTSMYSVIINNVTPTVTISADRGTTVTEGTSVQLTANVSGGNDPVAYSWGGDCSGSAQTTTVPSASGTYNCSVTVTDIDGDTDTANITVTVNALPETPTGAGEAVYGAVTSQSGDINGDGVSDDEQENTGEEEGEVLGEEACEETTKVSGYIYYDENENGKKDKDEEVLSGVTVIVYQEVEGEEKVVATVDTDENGYWEADVCPGEYKIKLEGDDLPENIEYLSDEVRGMQVGTDDLNDINFRLKKEGFKFQWWWCLIPLAAVFLLLVAGMLVKKKGENNPRNF